MECSKNEAQLLQQELVDHNDFFDVLVSEESYCAGFVAVVASPETQLPKDVSAVSPQAHSQQHMDSLRAKLHAKIALKQGNRPAPGTVSKRAARRAEKNKRREQHLSN